MTHEKYGEPKSAEDLYNWACENDLRFIAAQSFALGRAQGFKEGVEASINELDERFFTVNEPKLRALLNSQQQIKEGVNYD